MEKNRERAKEVNECIRKIKEGEYEAVDELYRLMGNAITYRSFKYFGNSMEKDDVIQDFWADIDVFCEKCVVPVNGFSYLLKCFENMCRMRLRASARHPVVSLDAFGEQRATDTFSEEGAALRTSFEKAKARMTDEEREVFSRVCYGQESVREIAAGMGISKSKADRLRIKVMETVKSVLTEDGWDENDE